MFTSRNLKYIDSNKIITSRSCQEKLRREFSAYPQDKILLPMAPVRIRGEDWKRHIPSCYLAELICALRSGGLYNGKLGQGSPPNWFPKSGKWSLRGFHNSSSGPNERKTDIVNLFFIPLVMIQPNTLEVQMLKINTSIRT